MTAGVRPPVSISVVPVRSPIRATTTVADGGDVAHAIAGAAAGSTIALLRGGTYILTSNLIITKDGVSLVAGGDISQPLPRLIVPQGIAISAAMRSGLTLSNLDISAGRATAQGIALHGCSRCTIAGCRISGFTFGVTIEAWPVGGTPIHSSEIGIRDNIILDNYNPAGHSTGLYADMTDGLVLSGNVFDHNGWSETVHGAGATSENHNVYLTAECGPATVSGNVFSRASSHGLQARAGGDVIGNLFLDNPIHMSFGAVNGLGAVYPGGVSGRIMGNAMTGTRSIGNQPRGIGVTLGNVKSADVEFNQIAEGPGGIFPAIQVVPCVLDPVNAYVKAGAPNGKPVGIISLNLANNAIWDWPGGAFSVDPKIHPGNPAGNTFCGSLNAQPQWNPPTTTSLRGLLGADDPVNPAWKRFRSEGADKVAAILAILRQAAGMPAALP